MKKPILNKFEAEELNHIRALARGTDTKFRRVGPANVSFGSYITQLGTGHASTIAEAKRRSFFQKQRPK